MKTRLRHGLYRVFVAVVIIPYFLLAVASRLFESLDATCGEVRHWCYQEKYVPKARRPGSWD